MDKLKTFFDQLKIRSISIDLLDSGDIDVTYYFHDSDEPFSAAEFVPGSPTREVLDTFETLILDL